MNTPNHAPEAETEALRGDLRASGDSSRPIGSPDRSSDTRIGGRR